MTDRPEGPLSPEGERELMRRLNVGDEDAVRVLYGRFARPVFGLGLRLLGSREAAEELTQDVFLTAWRKADRYDPERGRLSTWIMVIAHNLAVDRLRRESKRAAVATADLEGLVDEHGGGEDEIVDVVAARALLEGLTEGERKLLRLAYFQGWTAREIAESDGIPLGTVKTRLRTALIKLRRAHAERGEE